MSQDKITYLTVNDSPSGVYKSQVIDVVQFLNANFNVEVKIVAMIPLRKFFKNKKKLKGWEGDIAVLPMFPKIKYWKKSKYIFNIFQGQHRKIIARGPMAFEIAWNTRRTLVYDGRGEVKAELREFPDMIANDDVIETIVNAEKKAILNADFRIAVSSELVNYWQNEFGYSLNKHVVIPCTLSGCRSNNKVTKADIGFPENEVLLIYSGGIGGWQSFNSQAKLIESFILSSNCNVLFLTKANPHIAALREKYPNKIMQKWLREEEVQSYLYAGDYGVLFRDQNITNKVASPVKFAEYLAAGLQIIISENLGDYSHLVKVENLGIVVNDVSFSESLKITQNNDRNRIIQFSDRFVKSNFINQYKAIINV